MIPRRRYSLLAAAAVALISTACGREEKVFAPSAADEKAEWKGIGIWSAPFETAPIESVRGEDLHGEQTPSRLDKWIWQVLAVERLTTGYARAWPSIDHYWVAVRVEIRPDPEYRVASAFVPKRIVPRETVELMDDFGDRHFPSAVHRRLHPPIDRLVSVDTAGARFIFIFAVENGRKPAGIVFHDPLGDTWVGFHDASSASDWRAFKIDIVPDDPVLNRIMSFRLLKVKHDTQNGGPLSALVEIRNITDAARMAPNPAQARIYTGGGRTILSGSDSFVAKIGSKEKSEILFHFLDVPPRQSLRLILPVDGREAALTIQPDFPDENPTVITSAVGANGLRLTAYDFTRTSAGFRARLGFLNRSGRAIDFTEAIVTGLSDTGVISIPGSVSNTPKTLYPGYEERRWVDFPEPVSGATLALPDRRIELQW